MGHKTIKMTMRYAHLSQQHLQEAAGLIGLSLTGAMQKQMRAALPGNPAEEYSDG